MWQGFVGTFATFGDPEVIDSLQRCIEAGKILNDWFDYIAAYRRKMEESFVSR
jgi:hypothetical protein